MPLNVTDPMTAAEAQARNERTGRDWTLAYVLAGAVAFFALLAIVTSPVTALLGDSEYAIPSTLHGVSAIIYVITATVSAYLAYLMFVGRLHSYHDIRILAALNAAFATITVMFGNWIYIAYRATDGPRTYFLENQGAVHEIFFEFKEFLALYTVPVSVAAAYILLKEGEALRGKKRVRQGAAVLMLVGWAFMMLTFGLGAAITKLRSV